MSRENPLSVRPGVLQPDGDYDQEGAKKAEVTVGVC